MPKSFVHTLKLNSQTEWRMFCNGQLSKKGKLPDDIPKNPRGVYRNSGWVSMGDWLGTGVVAPHLRTYRPFSNARSFVQRLRLLNGADWKAYCDGERPEKGKLPEDIPANPNQTYRDKGWVGMRDWLGNV